MTTVSAPRTLTVIVSVLLVGLALLAMTSYLPHGLAMIRPHRLALLIGGYGVLLAGVVTRML